MSEQSTSRRRAPAPSAQSSRPDSAIVNGKPFRPAPGPPLAELGFDSAYRRFRLPAEKLETHEGRVEFWDRATQTAIEVREPTSPYHERPAQRLATLAERIAQVRGGAMQCFGTMDLVLLGKDGRALRLMQADQSLYLHPHRANVVGPSAMVVGQHQYPDVVLEVDRTTDIRRHKLKLYEAWGFPELWVDVPDESPRPSGAHGLTIHVLQPVLGKGAFKVVPESLAFPGWAAGDIHQALNEERLSERTAACLQRVGAALGEREGTGPDDDPLQRALRRQAEDAGRQAGLREGLARACASELERRAALVRAVMVSRHLGVAVNFPLAEPSFAEADVQDVANAAMQCNDEAHFATLLRCARKAQP